MPRTNAIIPVSKGIDQRLDERLRSADSLGVLTNAIYRRGDAVQKRNGLTRLGGDVYSFDSNQQAGHTLASEGAPRGLFSTGAELMAHGYTSLYGYNAAADAWYSRGHVSPFSGAQRDSFTSALSYDSTDCASGAGEIVHVASTNQYSQSTGGGFNGFDTSIVWRKETSDGVETLAEQTVVSSSGDADPKYAAPRIVNNGNGYIVGYQANGPVTFDLQFQPVVGNAIGAPFVTHSDVYNTGTDGNFARYDMTSGLFAGQWAYAYIRALGMGGTEIYVAIYTNTGLIVSTTIPAPGGSDWNCVALTFCSSQNLLSVVGGLASGSAQLYGLDLTTLAVTYGPINHPVQFAPYGIAIAETDVETDYVGGNVQECLSIVVNSGTFSQFNRYALDTILALPSNGSALTTDTTFNTYAVSKPWRHNNRIYCAAKCRYGREPKRDPALTVNDPYAYQDGYCGEVVLDLLQPYEVGAFVADVHVIGRYNFGVTRSASINGPSGEWDMARGSLANVTTTPGGASSVYRYATQRIINKVPGFNISQLAGDVVELDFDGKLLASPTTRGSATVGGGSVSWYAGRRAEELGFASAPIIARMTAVADPSGYPSSTGTISYIGVFESYDNRGNLVRSVPGPRAEYRIPLAGPWSVEVEFYTLGPSARYMNGKRFEVALYRALADGVYYRVSKPLDNNVIVDSNITSPSPNAAYDTGPNVSFDPVYTQSGAELEAAGPDGASFVATTSQRVWLAGFFRRDRVQYSKPYNAATANEFALAPEFNDAFAYLTPGGQPITGLAEMDDKVVVFTQTSIYAIAGNGPDDGGRNNDFSGLQLINSDTGCVDARSIVSFPGGIMFQAASGIFVLGRDFQLAFLGAQVRDITDEYTEVTSACLVPAANHVRFTVRKDGTSSIVLCYDLDQGAWIRWEPKKDVSGTPTALNIVGSCLHGGIYHLLDADGSVWKEDSSAYMDDGAIYVPMSIETSWLQAAQQSGYQRVRTVAALLKSNDAHNLTMMVYHDFASAPTQSYTWTAPTIALQKINELIELRTSVQKCTAFKIAIADAAGTGTTTGQGYECAGFAVELGGKRGLDKPGTQQRN